MNKPILFLIIIMISGLSMSKSKISFEQKLDLKASDLKSFHVETGAGSLRIKGADVDKITITATIYSKKYTDLNDLKKAFEKRMIFSLENNGSTAYLKAQAKNSLFSNVDIAIDIEAVVPKSLSLEVDDGSGSMDIENIASDLIIDDGSGSIKIDKIGGNVSIDDGSGSIQMKAIMGDVTIDDGSGGIHIVDVSGNVTAEDGSGSIDIDGLKGNFILIHDGSGSITINGERWSKIK